MRAWRGLKRPETVTSAVVVAVGRHLHGRVEHHRRDRGQPDAERREGAGEHVVDAGAERSLRRRRVGERDRAFGEVLWGQRQHDGGPGGDPASRKHTVCECSDSSTPTRPGPPTRSATPTPSTLGVVATRLVVVPPDRSPAQDRPGRSAEAWRVAGSQQACRQAVQGLSWAVLTGTAALGTAGVALAVGAGAVTVTFRAPL